MAFETLAGRARYTITAGIPTTYKFRNGISQGGNAVDWAVNTPSMPPNPPPTIAGGDARGKDYWPWYPSQPNPQVPPSVQNPYVPLPPNPTNTWTGSLYLSDSPNLAFPRHWIEIVDGGFSISDRGERKISFTVHIAARTKQQLNQAHKHYLSFAEARFDGHFLYDLNPGNNLPNPAVSSFTRPLNWTPRNATLLDTNVPNFLKLLTVTPGITPPIGPVFVPPAEQRLYYWKPTK